MSANRFNFRIWNSNSKRMSQAIHLLDFPAALKEECKTPFTSAVVANQILQSTGLATKNGKEVFEGDILEVPPWYGRPTLTGEVQFNEYDDNEQDADKHHFGWCMIYSLDGHPFFMTLPDALENDAIIIGNIYENPDLLKK